MGSPRYRHVIWDWNGTLLDDLDLCIEVTNSLLARRGLTPLDRARYYTLFDFPVRDYYARLGFQEHVDPFAQLSVEFISAYDTRRWECRLHPGAEAILEAVTESGMTQSILSAYRQETLREIVGHFGLSRHFIRLTGLDNIYAHSKLELGRAWVDELALPLETLVLVGDTLHDREVAEALGIDCVLVASGHHNAERLRQRSSRVVSDLAELALELGLKLPERSAENPA